MNKPVTLAFVLTSALSSAVLLSAALAQKPAFDPQTATEIVELTGPYAVVKVLQFSADSKRLAVGMSDPVGRIWDVEQGRIALQLTGHQYGISGLTYSNDGKSIITLGDDGLLKSWDATNGKEGSSFNLKCNASTGDVVMLKDGRAIVACHGLKAINLKNGTVAGTFKNASLVYRLALSPDQKSILGSIGYAEFQLWDTQALESFRTLKGHESQGFAVAYSPDAKVLATGASDNTVRLWNANTGKELKVLKGHDSTVRDVVFSPDGKILASASDDRTVRLWDVSSGEQLKSLEGHSTYVQRLAWSPDGKLLASGDDHGAVKLWGNP